MDWDVYDRQEDREPFDALLKAKRQLRQEDTERYEQEEKVQGYLRMVKMNADSAEIDPGPLRTFLGQSPAPDARYCEARLDAKISRILRWHYCLALYLAERGDWLAKAIPLMLESAEAASASLRSASYLLFAHNLNRWYDCNLDDKVLKSALRRIRGRRGDAHAHWCAKIVEDLEAGPGARDEVRDILMEIAGGAKPEVADMYLERAVSVAHDKGPAKEAWTRHHKARGDAEGDPLLRIAHYNKAKLHMEGRDGPRRIDAKIKEAQKGIRMSAYEHTWKAPKWEVRGRCGFERVDYLVRALHRSIPSVDAARKLAAELREEFPLQEMFTRVVVGDSGVPGPRPGSPADEKRADYVEQIANSVRFLEAVLSANVLVHEDDGGITADSYTGYLDTICLHDGPARGLVAAGVRSHFAGDYAASIHILLPQVEQTLRLLLEQKGVHTVGGRDRVRQDTLKGMITEGAAVLGEDLAEFLRAWLIDEDSTNLRNRVCHGLYGDYQDMDGYDPLHVFNHGASLLLVLTVCLLASMSVSGAAALGAESARRRGGGSY